MADFEKNRREFIRWQILITLNAARPIGAFEQMVLSVIQSMFPDSTQNEIRRESEYLHGRQLINIVKKPDGRWFMEIARYGVDVVEYTVDVEPGIARPEKYFDA